MDFKTFRAEINAQWEKISRGRRLWRVKATGDQLWNTYLDSFPAGTNEIYRTRREYDCNCCRQYIRDLGGVVTIENGRLVSIWGGAISDPNFQVVARAMDQLVTNSPIENVWYGAQKHAGTDHNFMATEDGSSHRWNHFYSAIPRELILVDQGPARNTHQGDHDVLAGGLEEITPLAIEEVLDLIRSDALYRGDTHARALREFQKLSSQYQTLTGSQRDVWLWEQSRAQGGAVSRIKNTSIGTLLLDVSRGRPLEEAVRAYEAMVAPGNYQRTKSISTPGMIKKAQERVAELGLTPSLERRVARVDDIGVNDVIWANRDSRDHMKTTVERAFDGLLAKSPPRSGRGGAISGKKISLDQLVNQVLPDSTGLEIFFANEHQRRMVSLTTEANPGSPGLFKWNNPVSWSYRGDVTDSIRERVKAAGGNVTGEFLARLSWFNYDDLDLSLSTPNGLEISFLNRKVGHGCLDVDMNAGGGKTRQPVENIYFPRISQMPLGRYQLEVNQFSQRETRDPGFVVELEVQGQVHRFERGTALKSRVKVATIDVDSNGRVTVNPVMKSTQGGTGGPRETVWGVETGGWVPVKMVMNSPNHWGDRSVGTLHRFFIIDGMTNPESVRGFYNEYLSDGLKEHRRVMELVGDRIRAEPAQGGLSGLGFNQTQPGEFLVRATTSRGVVEYQVTV